MVGLVVNSHVVVYALLTNLTMQAWICGVSFYD